MKRLGVAAVILLVAASTAPAASPPVRASFPRTAVVGRPWVAVLRASSAPTLIARGPTVLRARAKGKARSFRAVLRFPQAGTWTLSAQVGKRSVRLGKVSVDVAVDPLLTDPARLAVDPAGDLLVGQLREAPLLRLSNGRATVVANSPAGGVFDVFAGPQSVYFSGVDTAVYRLDGERAVQLTGAVDVNAGAVDAAGGVYVTLVRGWVKRLEPNGALVDVAGDGTEGYAGDGGPARAAKFFHPHAAVFGKDGALYIADTENRRIRRIDVANGTISTFGGDVGITISLAVGPDGSIYSGDADRASAGLSGGVTRTTPEGTTTRLVATPNVSGIAVTADGSVYVARRVLRRIDRVSAGALVPFSRGPGS